MQRSKRVLIGVAVAVLTLAAACGGSDSNSGDTGGGGTTESIRGQTITVLVPYAMPKSLLDKFTAETGVKVNYVRTGWDATHNKLLVANQAQSYIADVAEFDWSFTGQFAGAQWVEPLDGLVSASTLSDLKSTDAAFISGGKTYAACYSNDFRVSMYNTKMFEKAGITAFPQTLDELGQDVAKLKAAGVQYPLSLAMGGQLFDDQLAPTFPDPSSAGYQALQWEADAVKNGWVSPGSVAMDDSVALNNFTGGETAIDLATGPGSLPPANDPSQSSIAGHAAIGLIPGVDGPGASFGLPEGLSIPVTAKHKAAAAAFIEWWERPENAIAIYKTQGSLPCGASTIKQLADSGELQGGDVLNAELPHVSPLFAAGAPIWYSQFSSDAQGLLNAAVKGDMSVSDALDQLASKAESHNQ